MIPELRISDELRASMTWLHTWAGISVSCLLFVIFWMGSLTVFDREIDQWMKPELRIEQPQKTPDYDAILASTLSEEASNAKGIYLQPATERKPLIRFYIVDSEGKGAAHYIDPNTGKKVTPTDSFAGKDFFYPFHYSLHLPGNWGHWLVGFCAMAMLVLITSGIIIHRKIIRDFFTFRPSKALRRSTLDLHNLTSMIALPLHLLFPLTGLMIFYLIYFPWSAQVAFEGNEQDFAAAVYGDLGIEASNKGPPPDFSVNALIAETEAAWALATKDELSPPRIDYLNLFLLNDANAYATIYETFPTRAVSTDRNLRVVRLYDNEVLFEAAPGAAKSSFAWIVGAHYIQFGSWTLRWLYFAGGLLGSVMIASGLMFWIQSRIRKGAIEPRAVRVMRGLAIGSISGIILASSAYLVANRLIPASSDGYGMGRPVFEVLFFYIVWIASFVHAAVRGKFAWREQSLAIIPVAIAAVLLNWITTGHHPVAVYQAGLTPILSMDFTLLAGSGIAWFAAKRLKVPDPHLAELDNIAPEALPAE